MEVHGVEAQDEHLFPTPNRWTNQKDELGYLTSPFFVFPNPFPSLEKNTMMMMMISCKLVIII
jgi:hypothetical protein